MALQWYFLRCQSGREGTISKQAITRLRVAGVESVVPQIIVPYENITDLKGGKKKNVQKKLYPGYLMVQADLDDAEDPLVMKARATLRAINGLRDFLGARGEATAISEDEVSAILARMQASEVKPQVNIGIQKGDMVKIKAGAFDGFDGAVDDVNPEKGTVKVVVTIFGRPTPVELDHWEVESV
jgi:transcriptional antiterminator NusG